MKNLDGFRFGLSPVNEVPVRNLREGAFLKQRRNAVLVGARARRACASPSRPT